MLSSSTDMRSALTRAMTAAIVGKVVNFTVSRSNNNGGGLWSSWLNDWKKNGGASIHVQNEIDEVQQKQQQKRQSSSNLQPLPMTSSDNGQKEHKEQVQ
mmetsp:Transcript_15319/g.22826  ORF Transcript_15319/g.22826 Transcript_15319/m.22826 type:complete len:99 (+) Transcript_15319:1-297(+)